MTEPAIIRRPEIGWQRDRETLAELRRGRDIPPSDRPDGVVTTAEFSGHRGIYLANLEGVLGGRFPPLLCERDSLAWALLTVCGFQWHEDTGLLVDRDGNRWDDPAQALEEALASIELGWRAAPQDQTDG